MHVIDGPRHYRPGTRTILSDIEACHVPKPQLSADLQPLLIPYQSRFWSSDEVGNLSFRQARIPGRHGGQNGDVVIKGVVLGDADDDLQ